MTGICLAMAADTPAQRAEQLIELWSRLSMQHVALGGACGCAMGGLSLRLDDFELDIVDYLCDAGVRCGRADVAPFFTAWQQRLEEGSGMGGRMRPLRQLLDQVQQGQMPDAVAQWLLPKLEHTLNSYAQLHGPRLSD